MYDIWHTYVYICVCTFFLHAHRWMVCAHQCMYTYVSVRNKFMLVRVGGGAL